MDAGDGAGPRRAGAVVTTAWWSPSYQYKGDNHDEDHSYYDFKKRWLS